MNPTDLIRLTRDEEYQLTFLLEEPLELSESGEAEIVEHVLHLPKIEENEPE